MPLGIGRDGPFKAYAAYVERKVWAMAREREREREREVSDAAHTHKAV